MQLLCNEGMAILHAKPCIAAHALTGRKTPHLCMAHLTGAGVLHSAASAGMGTGFLRGRLASEGFPLRPSPLPLCLCAAPSADLACRAGVLYADASTSGVCGKPSWGAMEGCKPSFSAAVFPRPACDVLVLDPESQIMTLLTSSPGMCLVSDVAPTLSLG